MNYQPLPLMSSTAAPPLVRQISRFGLAGTSALAILMALLWVAGDCRAQNNTGASSIWYLSGVTLTSAAMPPPSWWHIAGVADFNGDGHPDILYQNPLTGESQVWLLGPGGTTGIGALGLSGPNNVRIGGVGGLSGGGKADVGVQGSRAGVSSAGA